MKNYKVIKENFLWEVWCILKVNESGCWYIPIDEVYKKHEWGEYISSIIIENSPDYFQRVYKVNLLTRTVYKVKEEAREMLEKQYKE